MKWIFIFLNILGILLESDHIKAKV